MFNFHQKRKIKRYLYSPLALMPLALIVFLLGTTVWNVYTKERETRINRDRQTKELESLNVRSDALEEEINRLSTERGREEEIRSKFEVAKEGEHVIVIVDPPEQEEATETDKNQSLWKRILSWF